MFTTYLLIMMIFNGIILNLKFSLNLTILAVKPYEIDWDFVWNFFGAIGSIATALTLIFIYFQRKDSIKPSILIEYRNDFKIKYDHIGDAFWSQGGVDFIEPSFSLINPGNGLAENIKVESFFNKDVFFEYLKRIDKDDHFNITFSKGAYFLTDKINRKITNFRFVNSEVLFSSALIDMKTSENFKLAVPLDYSYSEIVRATEFVVNAYKRHGYFSINDFPKLYYRIKFKDILGNKYSSYYELSMYRFLEPVLSFKKIGKSKFKRETLK